MRVPECVYVEDCDGCIAALFRHHDCSSGVVSSSQAYLCDSRHQATSGCGDDSLLLCLHASGQPEE